MVAEYRKTRDKVANCKRNMGHASRHALSRYLLMLSILVPVLVAPANIAMQFENGAVALDVSHSGMSAGLNDVMSGLHWR
ncbi:hypothetical protein DT594_01860 [Halopseudomonas laoshanensis]|uniref:Uncharacterized protein n=1 Tax=Halopseudomonas laoshanensis TaxID=2268758 RepID=A0A7V7KW70_9GAMM|nr:hypothetical protein [Halopseudomonas laoshanensis]KAA0696130.1 hypothetical protein DT594_01860 [Halopseudomonas laoshanensis]